MQNSRILPLLAALLPTFTRKATELIAAQSQAGKPFFLYMPLNVPHMPIVPSKEWQGKSGLGSYGDFVMETDWAVGEVLAALYKAGVGGDMRGSKSDIFDGGHRVPFIVRWPNRIKADSRSDQTICLTDLMATCADILGTKLPDNAGEDSVSILPALLGTDTAPLHESVVHHSVNGSFAIRYGKWKLELCADSGGWSAPTPGSKEAQGLPETQLYDLSAEIGETKNLQAERPEEVTRLTKLLEQIITNGRSTPGAKQANDTEIHIRKSAKKGRKANANELRPIRSMKHFITAIFLALVASGAAHAADLAPARSVTYKSVDGAELKLDIFEPTGIKATDSRPAIVFFFGGGWSGGSTKQFYQQAKVMAEQGMLAISADYRVYGRNKTTPLECVKDGKSAIRWVREHAAELGVDPTRVAAAGGSAGGHVAACTGVLEGNEEAGEKTGISSVPNAMILFNPVLDTTAKGYGAKRFTPEQQTAISPCHHVRKGIVPTMIFHGTADKTVPFENAERFAKLMNEAGNTCVLVPFEGKDHGFFNGSSFRKGNDDVDFDLTMKHSIEFLKTHGILK
jgi:acetyl esterase